MIGDSDNNRSESQGRAREGIELKEGRSEGTTVGTRNGREAVLWAMSVRENAKSNRHRKPHPVEPYGTGRKFMHLTRGDLWCESTGEVSRGHSSEEALGNLGGAKGRRTKREQSVNRPAEGWRVDWRNSGSVAISAASPTDAFNRRGGFPGGKDACRSSHHWQRKETPEDAQ